MSDQVNRSKKVVVTGASGFVGHALVTSLEQLGYDVVGLSRHQNGTFDESVYYRCPDGDLLIHLAEVADRHQANALGQPYLDSSTELTITLCEQFSGRVIYASSALVYGDRQVHPCREDSPVFVTDIYSQLKLNNEKQVVAAGGCVLRLANLFGLGMSANNVLSDILKQQHTEGPVSLHNVYPVRDFLPVDALIQVFLLLVNEFQAGIFNVGSGQGVSILTLAQTMLSLLGQEHREIVSNLSYSQPSSLILDISKITHRLGWNPNINLRDNLQSLL